MKKINNRAAILHVIPYFFPAEGFGGPVKVCFDIASHFATLRYRVTVATTDAGDNGQKITSLRETIAGINIIRFKNIFPKLTSMWNMFLPPGFIRWLRTHVRSFDLVHLHSYFTFQNIVSAYICKTNHTPYIIHLHESPVPHIGRGKFLVKIIFNQLFFRLIMTGASQIIALTPTDKKELISYYPGLAQSITVIPNGIAISKKHKKTSSRLRKNLSIPSNAFIILSLSRLAYLKGVDLLLFAFYELLKMKNDVYLLIVGPDEGQRRYLEEFVVKNHLSHRVRFLGLVTGRQKENVYKTSDIYALCSRYEPFSLTTLEALRYGLPVCLSKYVGAKDTVIRDGAGIQLKNIFDSKQTADDLLFTLKNTKILSKNCTRALRSFDIRRQFKAIELVYRSLFR